MGEVVLLSGIIGILLNRAYNGYLFSSKGLICGLYWYTNISIGFLQMRWRIDRFLSRLSVHFDSRDETQAYKNGPCLTLKPLISNPNNFNPNFTQTRKLYYGVKLSWPSSLTELEPKYSEFLNTNLNKNSKLEMKYFIKKCNFFLSQIILSHRNNT